MFQCLPVKLQVPDGGTWGCFKSIVLTYRATLTCSSQEPMALWLTGFYNLSRISLKWYKGYKGTLPYETKRGMHVPMNTGVWFFGVSWVLNRSYIQSLIISLFDVLDRVCFWIESLENNLKVDDELSTWSWVVWTIFSQKDLSILWCL